ncbi:MAG TPA: hypothetical protein VK698_25600 [Kofleriaceae bacterium]|nr:hypothetical protein [Kofleriaceae bacterium]
MSFTHAIRHVASSARSFGPGAALHELKQRVYNRVVPLQVLRGMTAELTHVPAALFDAGDYRGRFATRAEVLACATPDYEMTPDFARDALDRGDRCFAMFHGKRMASLGWYARQPTHISRGLVLHFDPAWVYMYKGFTHPDHRGKRLHGIGMSLALREHTERGARGLISYVRSTNFASLRSVERMGYRIFGDIYLARVMGVVKTWTSPGCADHGFRLESEAAQSPLATWTAVEAIS